MSSNSLSDNIVLPVYTGDLTWRLAYLTSGFTNVKD